MIDYIVVSVADILENQQDIDLTDIFKKFSCKKELDLEKFLHDKCLNYEKAGTCRTYLMLDKEELYKRIKIKILAFFSISTTTLEITDFSNRTKKKILGPLPQQNKDFIPVFLIGQLGRNDNCNKEQLPGEEIIGECLAAIKRAQEIVGGRIALVECREHLVKFYESHGFVKVTNERKLYQLYRKIS